MLVVAEAVASATFPTASADFALDDVTVLLTATVVAVTVRVFVERSAGDVLLASLAKIAAQKAFDELAAGAFM